ncbi:MAG: (4Fe-4S)-binding protein [Candidatus Tectimicrobiota bacterium]
MQVLYDAKVCIHAGNCVKSLPLVFQVVDGQFVIHLQAASENAIRQTVAACPSGALRITED